MTKILSPEWWAARAEIWQVHYSIELPAQPDSQNDACYVPTHESIEALRDAILSHKSLGVSEVGGPFMNGCFNISIDLTAQSRVYDEEITRTVLGRLCAKHLVFEEDVEEK